MSVSGSSCGLPHVHGEPCSKKRRSLYGGRTITMHGSIVFIVNNIIGPGLVAIPQLFQIAGWIPTVVMLLVGAVISYIASAMLCETHDCLSDPLAIVPQRGEDSDDEDNAHRTATASLTRYSASRPPDSLYDATNRPGATYRWSDDDSLGHGPSETTPFNRKRKQSEVESVEDPAQRLEFLKIVRLTIGNFSPTASFIIELAYYLLITALNIAAIVVSAQVVDELLIWMFGGTFALSIPGLADSFFASYSDLNQLPFLCITSGYVVLTVILLPLGLLSLDENMFVQFISFYCFSIGSIIFCVVFVMRGLHVVNVPAIGTRLESTIGTVLFTYAYTMVLPSWHNERKREVNCGKALWWSTWFSTIVKIAFGWMGALAYSHRRMGPNILVTMLSNSDAMLSPTSQAVLSLSVYIYSFAVIGLGVPATCVFLRYNLLNLEVVPLRWAHFFAGIFPWLVSWALYSATAFVAFLNYSSLLLNGITNFIIPFVIYLAALRAYGKGPTVEEYATTCREERKRMQAQVGASSSIPAYLMSNVEPPRHPALHSYALPSFLRGRHAVTTTVFLLVVSSTLLFFALGMSLDAFSHDIRQPQAIGEW